MQYENELRVKTAQLQEESNRAEVTAEIARELARVKELEKVEEIKIEMNRKKTEADVVIPAEAERKAKELVAIGESARILESGKATAEAVRLMREQWEKGNTRELFLIQQLPDIISKITSVVADNLSIEKLTIVDSGNGGGIPTFVKGVTGSIVAIMEQIKNAT